MPNRRHFFGPIHVRRPDNSADDSSGPLAPAAQSAFAQVGIAEIGKTHRYAAQKVATALAAAQTLDQAARRARRLTPAHGTALGQLRYEFLRTLLTLVQEAGVRMIDDLGHGQPLSQSGQEQRQHIDQLVARYLDEVHMILRR